MNFRRFLLASETILSGQMQWNIIFFQEYEEYLIISKFSSQKFPFNSIFPLEPTVLVERFTFWIILQFSNLFWVTKTTWVEFGGIFCFNPLSCTTDSECRWLTVKVLINLTILFLQCGGQHESMP